MIEGEPGRVLIGGFVVGPQHLNRHGRFHGGVGATLVDVITGMAAVNGVDRKTIESTGPSVSLAVS